MTAVRRIDDLGVMSDANFWKQWRVMRDPRTSREVAMGQAMHGGSFWRIRRRERLRPFRRKKNSLTRGLRPRRPMAGSTRRPSIPRRAIPRFWHGTGVRPWRVWLPT